MNKKILATILVALCGNAIASSPVLRIRIPAAGILAPAKIPETPGGGAVTPPQGGGTVEPDVPVIPPVTAALSFSTKVLDFGTLKIGTTNTLTLTATNTGKDALTIDYLERPYAYFSTRQAAPTTCKTGTVLQVGASCIVPVNFTVGSEGLVSEELNFDTTGGYFTVLVQGAGMALPAPLTVSQAPSGSLGIYAVGTTSGMGSYEYRFKNTTPLALTPTATSSRNYSTGGSGGTVSANTCVGAVQPGASCGFTFTPTYAAPGELSITYAETTNKTTVEYLITAEEPRLNLVSSSVSGLTKSFVFTNPNKVVPVSVLSTKVFGSEDFSEVTSHFDINGCSGTTLAPGQTCTMTVTYLPAKGALSKVTVGPSYQSTSGPTMIVGSSEKWW